MSVHAPNALAVACHHVHDNDTTCGAVPTMACTTSDGHARAPHPSRVAAARLYHGIAVDLRATDPANVKETIAITVLVEIEYTTAARKYAVAEALACFTRDGAGDSWCGSVGGPGGIFSVARSQALDARRTAQKIVPRKERS